MDVFLFSDMDRTVMPNGPQEESPQARPMLRALVARPDVTLTYVTGRHAALIREAIAEYDLPVPNFAIGDVGTTIYEVDRDQWRPWEPWEDEIRPDWRGLQREELADLLTDIEELRLQEPEKQNRLKLSYYGPPDVDREALLARVRTRLAPTGVRASLIWSVDELSSVGLLDVLPERATKVHAIRFLMQQKGIRDAQTVFAGDSGNDLAALTSGLQAVLVRNARDEVRAEVERTARRLDLAERIYFARGGFLGMNGNYSAGILEGLAHFLPDTQAWMAVPPSSADSAGT